MENENDYGSDVSIDRFDLELEWEKQSELYMKYAEEHANAVASRDHIKTQLNTLKAEIDLQIRKNYGIYGFDKKPTETAIQSSIVVQEEYIKKQTELNTQTHTVNILSAAKEALIHKKDALGGLTKLWLNNYYSEPDDLMRDRLQGMKAQREMKDALNKS